MSIRLMTQVWDLELSHPKQTVLMALADHAHDDGTRCYPGVRYLAWKTGYSERNVTRILSALEKDELIEAQDGRVGGRGHTTDYHLHLEKGVKKSPFRREEKGDRRSKNSGKNPDNSTQNPDKPDINPDKSARAYIDIEPSVEPSDEPSTDGVDLPSTLEETEPEESPPLDDTTATCLYILQKVSGFPRDDATNARKLAEYREEFSLADPVKVCRDFRAVVAEKPIRSGANPRLRLRNFFKKEEEWLAKRSSLPRTGASRFHRARPDESGGGVVDLSEVF